jgi:hypothetical protein
LFSPSRSRPGISTAASEPGQIGDREAPPGCVQSPGDPAVILVRQIFQLDDDVVPLADFEAGPDVDGQIARDRREERRGIDPDPQDAVLDLAQRLTGLEEDIVPRAERAVRAGPDPAAGGRAVVKEILYVRPRPGGARPPVLEVKARQARLLSDRVEIGFEPVFSGRMRIPQLQVEVRARRPAFDVGGKPRGRVLGVEEGQDRGHREAFRDTPLERVLEAGDARVPEIRPDENRGRRSRDIHDARVGLRGDDLVAQRLAYRSLRQDERLVGDVVPDGVEEHRGFRREIRAPVAEAGFPG